MIAFENKPEIGKGIYVTRDVAKILNMLIGGLQTFGTVSWESIFKKSILGRLKIQEPLASIP